MSNVARVSRKTILLVNQHGDNRGDEAAMRGLIAAIRVRVPDSDIIVFHQFASRDSEIDLHDVTYLPIRLPLGEALRMSIWAVFRALRLNLKFVLGGVGRATVESYERADLVISAPGGPYFGDLYWKHEVVHWFYVWLGKTFDKPVSLYQTSAGPFRLGLLNLLRRRGYGWFSFLSVREKISAENIYRLTGQQPYVGSDSALHQSVGPADLTAWRGRLNLSGSRPIVTVALRDPGSKYRARHDAAAKALLEYLLISFDVVLLPQLHGDRHNDAPYLLSICGGLDHPEGVVVVAPTTLSSDDQRSLIAASRFVIAGRYHPLVFAASSGVPAIVIPYEHKAVGFAGDAGLTEFVVELSEISGEKLILTANELLGRLEEVEKRLGENLPALVARAELVCDETIKLLIGSIGASR